MTTQPLIYLLITALEKTETISASKILSHSPGPAAQHAGPPFKAHWFLFPVSSSHSDGSTGRIRDTDLISDLCPSRPWVLTGIVEAVCPLTSDAVDEVPTMYAPVPAHRPGPYPPEHTRDSLIDTEIVRVKRNDNCQKTMTSQTWGLCEGNQ